MYDLNDSSQAPFYTPDSDSAPSYLEFKHLIENEFSELVAEGLGYRAEKKELESRIKDTDLSIMALMAVLPVKSVSVDAALVTFVDSAEAHTLDKKLLKQNLVKYGIPADKVKELFELSTKTSSRSASIRMKRRNQDDETEF